MRSILILCCLTMALSGWSRGKSIKPEWNYTFNKLDVMAIPTAAGFTYLGYLNYTAVRRDNNGEIIPYTSADIFYTQGQKSLTHYRFSDALDDFSSYTAYGSAIAGWLAAGPLVKWEKKKFWTVAFMYTEMMMFERGMAGIIKNVSRVPRPYVYDPSVSMNYKVGKQKDAFMSFYSGHTSFAFANAFFWSDMIKYSDWSDKWKLYGRAFLYGSATMVGTMRYFSGQHFAKDVIAGAGVGTILAYFTLKIHDIYDMEPYYENPDYTFVPTSNGIYFAYKF